MSLVRIEFQDDIAVVTVDNPPVNATSTAVRQGLWDAVSQVQGCRLAILKCAGRTFIAGGDMTEFDKPAQEPNLPDVVNAIEASPTPFVAALHGTVLGGGLEIAMGCAYRVAAPGTRFGLPEVNVGLVPGAGGTQRAPRLFGWEAAIDMACSGQMLTAEQALERGAIDAIAEDLDAAARAVSAPVPTPVSQRAAPDIDADWLADKRAAIAKKAKGQQSPLLNFDALQWAKEPFAEGSAKERDLHLKLRKSDESRALRHAFFSERAVAQPADIKGGTAKDINKVAIVGGGLMGAGIAAAFLNAGYTVTTIERDTDAVKGARERVHGLLAGALKRGKVSQQKHDAQRAAYTAGIGYDGAKDADLALEAVFEDVSVKQDVFRQLASVMDNSAILATNTSYLDPRDIFDGIENRARCVGLHFFSPAHIMKLLEVVKLPETSKDTLATAFALAKRLRKVAVLSGICDGFIGNRILAAYRRAAEYMLADGATPKQIDDAMRAFGLAMGPFEVQDLAGLQIAEANRRRQDATRDPNERYITIGDDLVKMGRTGQRAGKGWYAYEDGNRTPQVDPEVTGLIEAYSQDNAITRRAFSQDEIQTQLLAVMANEGARIVEEGVAENDAAIDMVKLHGYGFPRWRGGPMFAAELAGEAAIRAALDTLEAQSPGSWTRARRYATT